MRQGVVNVVNVFDEAKWGGKHMDAVGGLSELS